MVNYEIEPAILQPYVPAGTELDDWQGKTMVSVVGFMFLNTRVMGVPIPMHRNFEEINLRFYVRRWSGDEWRRGVVFIKEIVPRFAIASVARYVYNENYIALPMRHLIARDAETGNVSSALYGWRHRGGDGHVEVTTVGGDPEPLVEGSEEEFIAQHYWGYAAQRDGGTVEYQVEHPPWRVWHCTSGRVEGDLEALYGRTFAGALLAQPTSVFLAEGSEIVVHKGVRIAVRGARSRQIDDQPSG